MILFLIFIYGLFIGSFLNVVIDRLQRNETILKGRSYCEFCKKELGFFDLIPLFSFLFLKGKCRYCGKKLSLYYPIVEFVTGLLFAVTYIFVNSQLISQFPILNSLIFIPYSLFINLGFYLFIVSCFIVIFFTDLKFGIIPDKILLPAIIITIIYSLFFNSYSLIINLSSALGACAFFLILFLATKGKGMGFGDVKLAFLLGLILGFPKIVLALYIAFLTGAIVGIILIIWKKKRSLKSTIPFGPFLIIGSLISLFLGDLILPIILLFLGLR